MSGLAVADNALLRPDVDKESEVEYEVAAEESEPRRRDHGFVPGRSCVPIRPAPTGWQSEHASCAGMFSITGPRDLVGLLQATLLGASAEVIIFGVEPDPDRLTALARALSGGIRPAWQPSCGRGMSSSI
jgi:hypothetical protein